MDFLFLMAYVCKGRAVLNNRCLLVPSLSLSLPFLPISSLSGLTGRCHSGNQGAALLVFSWFWQETIQSRKQAFGETLWQTVSRYQRADVNPQPAPPHPHPLPSLPSKGRLSQKARPLHSEVIYRPGRARMNRLVIIPLKGWPDKERASL